MIILIHGSDTDASQAKFFSIKKTYKNKHIIQKDSSNSLDDIKIALSSSSFFSSSVGIFISLDKAPGFKEDYSFLRNIPNSNDAVIHVLGLIPKGNPLLVASREAGAQEYVFKKRKDNTPFSLADAVCARNFSVSFRYAETGFKNGFSPQELLGAVVFQFRNILGVKMGADFIKTLHPFVLSKAEKFEKNFTLNEVAGIYARLLDADVDLKYTSKNGEIVFLNLLKCIVTFS